MNSTGVSDAHASEDAGGCYRILEIATDDLMYLSSGVNSEMTPGTTYMENTPLERLALGDLVVTVDHGAQPVRWMTVRELDEAEREAKPDLYPIRIAAAALASKGSVNVDNPCDIGSGPGGVPRFLSCRLVP